MKKKIEERERGKLFPSFLKLWRAIFVKDVISKILLLSFIFSKKKKKQPGPSGTASGSSAGPYAAVIKTTAD